MRARRAAFSLVALLAATGWLGAQGSGSISGTVYERQGSLLGMVEGDDSSHDEVVFTLGKKGVNNSSFDVLPEGWECEPKGGAWRCWGPPRTTSFFSFQPAGNYRFPNRVELGVNYQGRSLFDSRLDVQSIGLPRIENDLEGILDTPARIAPGSFFVARPIQAGYDWGRWRAKFDDTTLEPTRLSDYLYRAPVDIGPGSEISFTYDGPWGERLVDAPANIAIGDPLADCEPEIFSCPSMATTGGSICVCGCFPDPTWGARLLLDGKPVGVNAASPWSTTVSLADVEPGRHEITWVPGSGGTGSVEFEAVRVGGKIDREVILKGGSTDLEFWIEGTRKPLDMDITTLNTNIGIHGGNIQTATTSGGQPNDVRRKLWGKEVGDFNVGFMIGLPPCPCGYMEGLDEDDLVRHPMSLTGQSNLGWAEGGLTLPIRFEADNVFGLAPRPPIDPGNLEVRLRQLGMRATAGTFGEFTFETRADPPSIGRFTNVEVDDQGHFRSGDVDFKLHAEFAVPYTEALPIRVGMRYDFGLSDWSFEGMSEDLGRIDFRQREGTASNVVFDRIESDRAGTLLHGWADFTLRGTMRVDF